MPGSAADVSYALDQKCSCDMLDVSSCKKPPEAGHCIPLFLLQVSMCVSAHVCLCVCVRAYVFVWSVHVYACRSLCVHVSVRVLYVFVCVCVLMYRLGGPRRGRLVLSEL